MRIHMAAIGPEALSSRERALGAPRARGRSRRASGACDGAPGDVKGIKRVARPLWATDTHMSQTSARVFTLQDLTAHMPPGGACPPARHSARAGDSLFYGRMPLTSLAELPAVNPYLQSLGS